MSDRYETPRWDDELEEVEDPSVAGDDEAVAVVGESDLDASSENVLDGWPEGSIERLEGEPAAAVAVPETDRSGPRTGRRSARRSARRSTRRSRTTSRPRWSTPRAS